MTEYCDSCGHDLELHREKGCYFGGTKASCRCSWPGSGRPHPGPPERQVEDLASVMAQADQVSSEYPYTNESRARAVLAAGYRKGGLVVQAKNSRRPAETDGLAEKAVRLARAQVWETLADWRTTSGALLPDVSALITDIEQAITECSYCPVGCNECWPPDCECYSHGNELDKRGHPAFNAQTRAAALLDVAAPAPEGERRPPT